MKDTKPADARLAQVALRQLGAFSRDQAVAAGLASRSVRRRAANGTWTAVLPGVYRAASTPESWHQKLVAALLWAGARAVISHLTAARLHGLEGLGPMRAREPIELLVPFGKRLKAPAYVAHQSRQLERNDRTTIDGIAVTSLARTLVDVSPRLGPKQLNVALDSGLARHRHLDLAFLRRELGRLRTQGRRISPHLGPLLDDREGDAGHLDSALERRFLAALKHAGLPRPEAHYDVVEGGRRLAEVDFAYPEVKLAIELQGAEIHRRRSIWERDQARLSDLAAAGWRVLLVTWAQLELREAEVLGRIGRALRADGK
jgi:hypothetical protein